MSNIDKTEASKEVDAEETKVEQAKSEKVAKENKPRFGMGLLANNIASYVTYFLIFAFVVLAIGSFVSGNVSAGFCAAGVSACALGIFFRLDAYAKVQGWHQESEDLSDEAQEKRRQKVLQADEPFGRGPLASVFAYFFFAGGAIGWLLAAWFIADSTASLLALALSLCFWLASRKINHYTQEKGWG